MATFAPLTTQPARPRMESGAHAARKSGRPAASARPFSPPDAAFGPSTAPAMPQSDTPSPVARAFNPNSCGKKGICVPHPEDQPLLKSAGGAKTTTSCRPAAGKVQLVLNDYRKNFLSNCRADPPGLFSAKEVFITNPENESRSDLFNGWPQKLNVDCLFGNDTKKATKGFQAAVFQDPKEWDGVVGEKTWHALDEFERRKECFLTATSVTSGAAKKLSPKGVGVRITNLVGGSGTAERDIKTANEIYKQANVKVAMKGAPAKFDLAKTVSLIGPDLTVDNKHASPSEPTAEERAVITSNDDPGSITAYYTRLPDAAGFAWTPQSGQPHAFIVSPSASDTFAHELAHILLNEEGHEGDRNNFMAEGGGTRQNMMNPEQIKTIRDGNPFVK